MVDDGTERALWAWTAMEIAGLLALAVGLAASLSGRTSWLSSVSRQVRLGALVFVGVELLIPLLVYADLRRNPGRSSGIWLHAAATALVNVFGLLAYLVARRRGG